MYDGDVCKWVRNNIILMFMKKEREREQVADR